VYALKKKFT